MKKVLLFILIILLTGCSSKTIKEETTKKDLTEEAPIKEEGKYEDDNPIKLGLFLYDNNYSNKSVLEKEYYTNFTSGVDIGSFEVFLTDEKTIDGTSFKNTWNKYYSNYNDIDNYKVGFNVKFILSDGTNFNTNFLEPDIFKFSEYFYVYLYDDINQEDGTIYSHLETMSENTMLTSIKLYAVEGIDKVENIILTAFTYDGEEDFDSDGNYRGSSSYTIRIKRK